MARKRSRQRGFTALEEILSITALLGCFAVPLSLAARTAGQHIADETERAHATLLTQRR